MAIADVATPPLIRDDIKPASPAAQELADDAAEAILYESAMAVPDEAEIEAVDEAATAPIDEAPITPQNPIDAAIRDSAELTSADKRLTLPSETPTLNPKDDVTKKRYFEIYRDIVGKGMLEFEVAGNRGMTVAYVNQIKNWCQNHLAKIENAHVVEDLKYRLMLKRGQYAELTREAEDIRDTRKCIKTKLDIMREDRSNDILLAKLEGWLSTNIELGDKIVNFVLPDNTIKKPERPDVIDGSAEVVE